MNNPLRRAAVVVSLSLCSVFANATLIEFLPSDQTADLGDQAFVEIRVTPDSGVLIGGFDITVNYDASILSVFDVVFGTSLDDSLFPSIQDASDLGGGALNLFEVSFVFDLTTLQDGSPFVLASILFDTRSLGTSSLSFTDIILSDEFGLPLPTQTSPGSIMVVEPPVSVPEPLTSLLLLTGLGAMLLRRRK